MQLELESGTIINLLTFFPLVQLSFPPVMSHFLAGRQTDISLSCFLSGFQLQNGKLDKSLIYLFVLNLLIAYLNQGNLDTCTGSCYSLQMDWIHYQFSERRCSNEPVNISIILNLNSSGDGSTNNTELKKKTTKTGVEIHSLCLLNLGEGEKLKTSFPTPNLSKGIHSSPW